MIRKKLNFVIKICNLQVFYTKSRKYSSLFFSTLVLLFPEIIYIEIFHLAMAFQQYQIFQILLYIQIVIMARKVRAMNKKTYFRCLLLLQDLKKNRFFVLKKISVKISKEIQFHDAHCSTFSVTFWIRIFLPSIDSEF